MTYTSSKQICRENMSCINTKIVKLHKNINKGYFYSNLTYLCSASSCMNACNASTAKENDINTRKSCLNRHLQKHNDMLALIITKEF